MSPFWCVLRNVMLLALWAGVAHAQAPVANVGMVTFAIGESRVERNGTSQPLGKGDAIQPGDVLRTTANGHIHIHFIDASRISVRPASVFRIVEFHYDPVAPAASTIRFQLDQGDVRAISGEGAKAARDRFRLNTPLVAIGVKGTDFVVRAGIDQSRVTVSEGAVVVAPFGQHCAAGGLGACKGEQARELSADMGQALIYRSQTSEPVYQTLPRHDDSHKLHRLSQQMQENAADADALSSSRAAIDPLSMAQEQRMIWGRWANIPVLGDILTQPFLEAMQQNEVTVGDGYYFLFREPNAPNLLGGISGSVDFMLNTASAYYRTPANEIAAASVQGGTLGIDFDQNRYTTRLSLTADNLGEQAFAMTGSIDPKTGIFLGQGNNASSLAGALTLDGQKAGYLFRQPVGNGVLQGATLWGR